MAKVRKQLRIKNLNTGVEFTASERTWAILNSVNAKYQQPEYELVPEPKPKSTSKAKVEEAPKEEDNKTTKKTSSTKTSTTKTENKTDNK